MHSPCTGAVKATQHVLFRPSTKIVHLLQPRAGGGRLPQLYEAKVHVRLRLGIISRLLIMVYFYIARVCVPGCIAYVKRATSQIACISVHGVRLVAKYSKRGE